MRHTEIKDKDPAIFRRLTGVTPLTFTRMVKAITEYKLANRKHPKSGKKSTLSIEDKVLMLLMYYREYRTFLHISLCYGISEMHCWRTITQLEKILLESKDFRLPGKKSLHSSENNFEFIVVDVSEHPIERPKKTAEKLFR